MNNAEKIREALKDLNLDAMLITSKENRRYVTGFSGSNGYVIVTKDRAVLITDFRYTQQAAEQATHFEIIKYEFNIIKKLKDIIESLPIKNIGYETDKLTDKEINLLRKEISVNFVAVDGVCVKYREVKEKEEIEKIRKAVDIADEAFGNLIKIIKPGMTEHDVALELAYLCGKAGAQGQSFNTIVASGYRTAMAHAEPTNKVIEKGEMVTIDFGVIWEGYVSDMTRTISIGKPTDKMQHIFNVVLKAQEAALKAVKAGISCDFLDSVHRQVFYDYGLEQYSLRSLGHGVGLEVHDSPRVAMESMTELKNQMVITIEPGLYIEGLGGVRIEELVVVLEDGCEILTKSPKIVEI